ncbi:MAG: 3'-5' exonuclease domain-containing protein 2 [Bacteroidaceae bacterium]|nr:3'-5' exonuclease domain-containing protein 2 [Bacteroidaceae bacterium]
MDTAQRRILVNRFDKHLLANLPRADFQGRIIVIDTIGDANKAVRYLQRQPLLGFDTETRPTFRPGPMNQVALLQVSTPDTCFLFRLCRIGLPNCLVRLMGNRHIRKVALSWVDDTNQLKRLRDFKMGEFIELQTYVRQFGIEDASLQKLYANVLGQKISKAQQLSNWEADVLKEPQKQYAATDAWACIRLYSELEQLKENGNWELKNNDESVS